MVLPRDRHVVTDLRRRRLPDEHAGAGDGERLGLPTVNIIWSDGAYGVIEVHQRRKFDHLAGTKFTNPDFVKLAESFGCAGMRVGSAADLVPTLKAAFEQDVPSVVEIPIDYRENVKFSMNLADLTRVEEGVT